MILPEQNFKLTGEIAIKGPVYFTSFEDRFALVKYDYVARSIDDLADLIRRTKAASKKDLPWIKLACFNGIPNPKAANPDFPSLRYNAAVVEIYGVEGHDGKLPMAIAAARLVDIECLLYNTASSTPEARSVAGFGKHHDLSRSRVYELIADGAIIARKCGGRPLIFDADNQNFRQSLPILRSAGK